MTLFAVRLAVMFSEAATCQRIHAKSTYKVFRVPFLIESINTSTGNWLSTARAQRSSLLMVVCFTIGFATNFKEAPTTKRLLAIGANKVLRVPLLSQGIDTIASNWVTTTSAFWCKESIEICLTIGSSITFVKVSTDKRLQTLSADKVISVPLLAESSDAFIQHWFVTVSTLRTVQLLEASLTMGSSALFKEIPCTKRFSAITTRKMLRVISLAKCLNELS